jgi:hypothetical protein
MIMEVRYQHRHLLQHLLQQEARRAVVSSTKMKSWRAWSHLRRQRPRSNNSHREAVSVFGIALQVPSDVYHSTPLCTTVCSLTRSICSGFHHITQCLQQRTRNLESTTQCMSLSLCCALWLWLSPLRLSLSLLYRLHARGSSEATK